MLATDPRFAPERQAAILAQLTRDGRVVSTALARELGVSIDTIRRDLDELEAAGLLKRVHGGAVRPLPGEPRYADRLQEDAAAKERIAALAAPLIADGDCRALRRRDDDAATRPHVAARPARDGRDRQPRRRAGAAQPRRARRRRPRRPAGPRVADAHRRRHRRAARAAATRSVRAQPVRDRPRGRSDAARPRGGPGRGGDDRAGAQNHRSRRGGEARDRRAVRRRPAERVSALVTDAPEARCAPFREAGLEVVS